MKNEKSISIYFNLFLPHTHILKRRNINQSAGIIVEADLDAVAGHGYRHLVRDLGRANEDVVHSVDREIIEAVAVLDVRLDSVDHRLQHHLFGHVFRIALVLVNQASVVVGFS